MPLCFIVVNAVKQHSLWMSYRSTFRRWKQGWQSRHNSKCIWSVIWLVPVPVSCLWWQIFPTCSEPKARYSMQSLSGCFLPWRTVFNLHSEVSLSLLLSTLNQSVHRGLHDKTAQLEQGHLQGPLLSPRLIKMPCKLHALKFRHGEDPHKPFVLMTMRTVCFDIAQARSNYPIVVGKMHSIAYVVGNWLANRPAASQVQHTWLFTIHTECITVQNVSL